MPIRVHVASTEQADAVWQLLQQADDHLFPLELWVAGQLVWVATRTPAGLLTTLAPDPLAHTHQAPDPAAA